MELPISDYRVDGFNKSGVDIVVASNMEEVLNFTVRYFASQGIALCLNGKIILPGSLKQS